MPFTNVWDTTFPPDTQLANQLGLDLRNFRLDTQQRMAAISGLDAAKPAFGADAQPANWNGVLFFAIDTRKIYQWNNPVWTDVTTSFPAVGTTRLFQDPVSHDHTGTMTLDTIYTIPVSSWNPGNTIRVRYAVNIFNQGVGTTTIKLYTQANGILLSNLGFTPTDSGHQQIIDYLICNGTPNGTGNLIVTVGSSNVDTAVVIISFAGASPLTSLLIEVQSANNADEQLFGPLLAELIP